MTSYQIALVVCISPLGGCPCSVLILTSMAMISSVLYNLTILSSLEGRLESKDPTSPPPPFFRSLRYML